jgi:hypothetical protein
MDARVDDNREVFSFHLVRVPVFQLVRWVFFPPSSKRFTGLKHWECFFPMKLGKPILSFRRFNFNRFACFAWWQDEQALETFLASPPNKLFTASGWHVRLKKYRYWGSITEIAHSYTHSDAPKQDDPVVGITLARLKLSQTWRFIKWGKPVEQQVRDHPGCIRALAATRPLGTFSTFSLWKNEGEMIKMVQGTLDDRDGPEHRRAMQERARNPFHHEFMTMRFIPIGEVGAWEELVD